MPTISIIIPVYNALPYFYKCLDSIYSQETPLDEYEVILVDDGSTDGSGAVCDRMQGQYPNTVVRHCENSGSASRPRNIGIGLARGEYVFFCDGDDKLTPGSIAGMLQHAKDSGCDVGLFKIDRSDWGGNYRGLFDGERHHVPLSDEGLASLFGPTKLIKRALLLDNKITFVEHINPEDWVFSLDVYYHAQNICVFSDQDYYVYRKRADGMSMTLGGLDGRTKRWDKSFGALKAYAGLAQELGIMPAEYPWLYRRIFKQIQGYLKSFLVSDAKDELLARARNLLAPFYSDDVRKYLPFSCLIAIDALMDNCSFAELRDILFLDKGTGRIGFVPQDGDTPAHYLISYTGDGTYDRSVCMPETKLGGYGPELCKPGYKKLRVEKAVMDDEGLHVAGHAFFMVRLRERCEFDAATFHCVFSGSGATVNFPVKLEQVEWLHVYEQVAFFSASWSTICSFQDVVQQVFVGGGDRLDLALELSAGDKTSVRMSLGSVCSSDALSEFGQHVISVMDYGISPLVRPSGNFSLMFAAHADVSNVVGDCGITELSWSGSRLLMQGTAYAPCERIEGIELLVECDKGTHAPLAVPGKIAQGRGPFRWQWNLAFDLDILLEQAEAGSVYRLSAVLRFDGRAKTLPLGKTRPSGTLANYQSGLRKKDGLIAQPDIVDNLLCVRVLRASSLLQTSQACAISALAWHGDVLYMAGTVDIPVLDTQQLHGKLSFVSSAGIVPSLSFPVSLSESAVASRYRKRWETCIDISQLDPLVKSFMHPHVFRRRLKRLQLNFVLQIDDGVQSTQMLFGHKRPVGTRKRFEAGPRSVGKFALLYKEDKDHRLCIEIKRV